MRDTGSGHHGVSSCFGKKEKEKEKEKEKGKRKGDIHRMALPEVVTIRGQTI
jgi:hypothetical protein